MKMQILQRIRRSTGWLKYTVKSCSNQNYIAVTKMECDLSGMDYIYLLSIKQMHFVSGAADKDSWEAEYDYLQFENISVELLK